MQEPWIRLGGNLGTVHQTQHQEGENVSPYNVPMEIYYERLKWN